MTRKEICVVAMASLALSAWAATTAAAAAAATSDVDEEPEVFLQFFEFDLEDNCAMRSDAEWAFLNGTKNDLKQLLELELREAELYKNETERLRKVSGRVFSSKRLQRLFDIFFHPGAPLLGSAELNEYKEYSVRLQEVNLKMGIGCEEKVEAREEEEEEAEAEAEATTTAAAAGTTCVPKNARDVDRILRSEKNEVTLKKLRSDWFAELEERSRKSKIDFMQHLSILDIEAEQNEADDVSDYWLKQSDMSHLDYRKMGQMWKELIPLYQKLRHHVAAITAESYGSRVFIDKKLFPAHLLGSLRTENWLSAAEKLGVFDGDEAYARLKAKLSATSAESVYKMADNFTSEARIGDLPREFYNRSRFDVRSPHCRSKVMDYCFRKNALRAASCADEDVTVSRFVDVHEDVARLKHLIAAGKEAEDEENGFLFREGPRDSVIYEAVAGLTSVLAVRPSNLRKQELLPNATLPNEEVTSLFITALHVLPALPYYLAADMWRINALREMDATLGETTYDSSSVTPWFSSSSSTLTPEEVEEDNGEEEEGEEEEEERSKRDAEDCVDCEEDASNETTPSVSAIATPTPTPTPAVKVYDFENLRADWWRYREQLQGIGNADGKHHADFLQDEKIIWNKPYASKFLGKIVQFQLLEYFKRENFTTNTVKIQSLLRKGKSKPFQEILEEVFNITEISTKPLLAYFKPLEEFLDGGGRLGNGSSASSSSSSSSSIADDLSLFSQGYSMNVPPLDEVEKGQTASNSVVFVLLILATLAVVVVTIFIALRRYRRKQRAKERRKRLNEAIN